MKNKMVFDGNPEAEKAFSETLDGLRTRRRNLELEIKARNKEWRQDLAHLDKAISALEKLSGENSDHVSTRKRARGGVGEGSLTNRLRNMAISELATAERPLSRSELLQRLLDKGLQVDKKEPAKFLTRVLWRSKELVNHGDGYWLASRPRPRQDER